MTSGDDVLRQGQLVVLCLRCWANQKGEAA